MTTGASTQITVRVRYAETDKMNVVYHANYFVWFEIGRIELLRQHGFDYRQMEMEDELYLPVVEAQCRFRASAVFDDEVRIETRVTALRSSLIRFGYRAVRAGDGKLLAEGETTHVVTGPAMKRRSLPEKYLLALRAITVKD